MDEEIEEAGVGEVSFMKSLAGGLAGGSQQQACAIEKKRHKGATSENERELTPATQL